VGVILRRKQRAAPAGDPTGGVISDRERANQWPCVRCSDRGRGGSRQGFHSLADSDYNVQLTAWGSPTNNSVYSRGVFFVLYRVIYAPECAPFVALSEHSFSQFPRLRNLNLIQCRPAFLYESWICGHNFFVIRRNRRLPILVFGFRIHGSTLQQWNTEDQKEKYT